MSTERTDDDYFIDHQRTIEQAAEARALAKELERKAAGILADAKSKGIEIDHSDAAQLPGVSTEEGSTIEVVSFDPLSGNHCFAVIDRAGNRHSVPGGITPTDSELIPLLADSIIELCPYENLDSIRKAIETIGSRYESQQATQQEASKEPPAILSGLDILHSLLDDLENDRGDQLYRFGEVLDGLEIGPGYLMGLAAPPATGKTAFAGQATFEALEHNPGLKVYIANAESPFRMMLKRELSGRTNAPPRALRFANLSPNQKAEVREAGARIAEAMGADQVCVLPTERCTLEGLAYLYHECEPGFLVVDYLQKFAPFTRDVRQGVNEVMGALRKFASKGWGVLALSATARTHGKGGSAHNGDQLTLASFKESGEIEFNLDAGYLLRDRGEVTPGDRGVRNVVLDCVKNRHGERAPRDLIFDMRRMRFRRPEPDPFSDLPNDALDTQDEFDFPEQPWTAR